MSSFAGPEISGIEAGLRPRERIIRAAYQLFCRDGVQGTGVDRIIAEAGVAKASFYRHFPSKEDLVIAVLGRREEVWTRDWLQREVESRAPDGRGRLLAVFDVFSDWFRRPDYEGCLFINTMLEAHARPGRIGAESVEQLLKIQSLLQTWAAQEDVGNPAELAGEWQVLMMGAIVATQAGDRSAGDHARAVGALLLDRESRRSSSRAAPPS